MKKALFLIIVLLALPSFPPQGMADPPLAEAWADLSAEAERATSLPDRQAGTSAKVEDFVFSGYTEVGKRSTAEDYEEEDTDDDYTYRNFHLKFKQEVSERLSYDISSFIYDKDYNSKDSLNNISRIFKTNWSYYLKKLKPEGSGLASDSQSHKPEGRGLASDWPQGHGLASYGQSHSQSHKEESLKLDFRLEYKEKRYDNAPIREYDQIRVAPTLTFKKKDIYTVNLTAGINNFNYLEAGEKDQLKIFGELGGKRYLLEKKLMLTSAYKIETTEQKKINRQRLKHNLMGGFDYIFGAPLVYEITTRASWGKKDTKEEEERDEDYDYEYWRYLAKTEHRINPKLNYKF